MDMTHDPRNIPPVAFRLAFSAMALCLGAYQHSASRARAERAWRILDANEQTRERNNWIRSRRLEEEADAALAELDADLDLV
jgi:hypothetical protein